MTHVATRRAVASRPTQEEGNGDVKCASTDGRRVLRSHYRRLKASIAEETESFTGGDASRFDFMVRRADDLHDLVQKPREQISDAEALLDITDALLKSIKESRRGAGVKASDLVVALLQTFSVASQQDEDAALDWWSIGREASYVLHDVPGMCTMLGPMDIELKTRKAPAARKRARAVEISRPETIDDKAESEQTQTDKNIKTMFNIVRKCGQKGCFLEHLVLNGNSFAETVENIFFLSFLVKDGRAEISIQDGRHVVATRNAPTAAERSRRSLPDDIDRPVVNQQFVFRYDFQDWKNMKENVERGQELMPPRSRTPPISASTTTRDNIAMASDSVAASELPSTTVVTPIRMTTRNRGRVIMEEFDESNLSVELTEGSENEEIDHAEAAKAKKRIL